jgi:hypothetical protein
MRKAADVETVPSPGTSRGLEEMLAKLSSAISDRLNEDVPQGERSEKIAGAVGLLIGTGHSDDEIQTLIEAHAIGDKFDGQPAKLRRDIERLRAKGFSAKRNGADMFKGVPLPVVRAAPPLQPAQRRAVARSP